MKINEGERRADRSFEKNEKEGKKKWKKVLCAENRRTRRPRRETEERASVALGRVLNAI